MDDDSFEKASWLQRLKEQSWEAELLVSAIGTFASFQLFSLVDWLMYVMIDWLPPSQYFIGYLATYTGMLAVSMLTTMFILHLFLRFYWVGLVGLDSVFNDADQSTENSFFSPLYTAKMLAILPKVKDTIRRVDEQCSVIFSVAFCMMVIYAYFAVLVGLYLIFYNFMEPYLPQWLLLVPAIFIASLAVIQSLISAVANVKRLHNNEKIQILYYHTTRFQNQIFLGPFLKPILQIFMSFGANYKNKKGLFLLTSFCFLLGLSASVYFSLNSKALYFLSDDYYADETKIFSEFYAHNNEDVPFLIAPEIGSEILQSQTTTLFIPIFSYEKRFSRPLCDQVFTDRKDRKKSLLKMDCYHHYHQVNLNGNPLSPSFKRMTHPLTGQMGLFAFLDVSSAQSGENLLTISKMLHVEGNVFWSIPFYKESSVK